MFVLYVDVDVDIELHLELRTIFLWIVETWRGDTLSIQLYLLYFVVAINYLVL